MVDKSLPNLPPFQEIEKYLDTERETIIKVNAFSEEDDFVRTVKEAELILKFLKGVQTKLLEHFKIYPSLLSIFNNDFIEFSQFLRRDTILEICFLDEFLFIEQEIFPLEENEILSHENIKSYNIFFDDWIKSTTKNHLDNLEILKETFSIKLKQNEMPCACINCLSEFRNQLREAIYLDCINGIEEAKEQIEENLEEGLEQISSIFYTLQKKLDKTFHQFRYKLKKSTLNKLESKIKAEVKETFTYPSELSKKHSEKMKDFFQLLLKKEGLRSDLISAFEYERFFSQLSQNIWRGEKYLEREFKKNLKSILALKRKDISGKILKEYLGEFWIHSRARDIKRKIIYHLGPTNSGKTYHAIEALVKAKTGCYLAPLRLLAAELYDTMNQKGAVTSLMTGEEVIEVEDCTHYSSTVEMAKLGEYFDCCVLDEIQMISDPQRGWAWTRALVNIFADEVHICGDGSVLSLIEEIVELCGDELEVKHYERMTKLEVSKQKIRMGDLARGDALIVFSRRNALRYKMDLEHVGFKVSIVYGRLSPEVRREQARKFDEGETDIIVSTDAISMGMNLPIKRIVFSTLSKYINSKEHPISISEIKQISGRAGRYKRFPTGYVTCLSKVENGIEAISEAMTSTLRQKDKGMVGPDLNIFNQVNEALEVNSLPILRLSEFLRLFNTMTFKKPFYCVDLKEMIDVTEMVESADVNDNLSSTEIFGFACAPVNLGLLEHVQYFVWILNNFVRSVQIKNEPIESQSDDIDYLETAIKCVELYQWLSRHFNCKNFEFEEIDLLANKTNAVEKLNLLLSNKIVPTCSSCGKKIEQDSKFRICEECFRAKKFSRNRPHNPGGRKEFKRDNNKDSKKRHTRNSSYKGKKKK